MYSRYGWRALRAESAKESRKGAAASEVRARRGALRDALSEARACEADADEGRRRSEGRVSIEML